jgi:hypothetical protein
MEVFIYFFLLDGKRLAPLRASQSHVHAKNYLDIADFKLTAHVNPSIAQNKWKFALDAHPRSLDATKIPTCRQEKRKVRKRFFMMVKVEPFLVLLRTFYLADQIDSGKVKVAIFGNRAIIEILGKDSDKTLASLCSEIDIFNTFDLEDSNTIFSHLGIVCKVADGLTDKSGSDLSGGSLAREQIRFSGSHLIAYCVVGGVALRWGEFKLSNVDCQILFCLKCIF